MARRSNIHVARDRLTPTVRRAQRPMFYGGEDPITLNRMEMMVNNITRTMSGSWFDRFRGTGDPNQDPRRSIDDECGYPTYAWSSEEYHDLIMRDPVAALCNEFYPIESWPVIPQVFDVDREKYDSEFELAFYEFANSLGDPEPNHFADPNTGSAFWGTCVAADILCGEGRHGGIYIDFADGKDPSEPVTKKKGMKVNFLQALPEYMCRVAEFDSDPKSVRKNMPTRYQVWFSDPHETTSTGINESFTSSMVHASRIVHVVDRWHTAPTSRVFGQPRLRQLRDPILDARKVRGGSAEGYWKGMFMGLHFGTHPELGADVHVNIERLRDMYENYQNGIQRGLFTNGMYVDPLAPQVADPEKHLLVQYQGICIKMRAPFRVVMGSEVGQLATEKDLVRHYNRCRGRQTGHNNPAIIYPLVNRLINYGALPEPQKENKSGSTKGGAKVYWPDIATQSDKEKADALLVKIQAYGQYVANDIASIVPPLEFMTEFDDLPKDRAEAILDAAEQAQIEAEEEAQQAADELGLVPDMAEEGFRDPPVDPIEMEKEKAKAKASARPPVRNAEEEEWLVKVLGNCGGKGGKPGPCPSGIHDDNDEASSTTHSVKTERGEKEVTLRKHQRETLARAIKAVGRVPTDIGGHVDRTWVQWNGLSAKQGKALAEISADTGHELVKKGSGKKSFYQLNLDRETFREVSQRSAAAGKRDLDWRHTETTPEDFYANFLNDGSQGAD